MGLRSHPWVIPVLILIIVMLFGSSKLPDLARNMGRALKIVKKEVKELREEDAPAPAPTAPAPVAPAPAAPQAAPATPAAPAAPAVPAAEAAPAAPQQPAAPVPTADPDSGDTPAKD